MVESKSEEKSLRKDLRKSSLFINCTPELRNKVLRQCKILNMSVDQLATEAIEKYLLECKNK